MRVSVCMWCFGMCVCVYVLWAWNMCVCVSVEYDSVCVCFCMPSGPRERHVLDVFELCVYLVREREKERDSTLCEDDPSMMAKRATAHQVFCCRARM